MHVFLTSALAGEWSASRLVRFTPRDPLARRLRGLQNPSGRRGEKNLTPYRNEL
jgi:hypothetical protein